MMPPITYAHGSSSGEPKLDSLTGNKTVDNAIKIILVNLDSIWIGCKQCSQIIKAGLNNVKIGFVNQAISPIGAVFESIFIPSKN